MTAPTSPVTWGATEKQIKSDLNFEFAGIVADDQNIKAGTLLSLNASNELQTATNWDILAGIAQGEIVVDTNTYNKKVNYRRFTADDTYIFATTATLVGATPGTYYSFDSNHKVVATSWRSTWDATRQLQLVEVLSSTSAVFRIIGVEETGEIVRRTVTLTSAQVLASNTTPITLVPAPGAWKAVHVESIVWSVDYNSAAYATNTTMEARYTDGSGTKVTADITSLLTATADTILSVWGIEAQLVLTQNAPVVIRTATGNPATGNSPVTFTVFYRVVSVA